MEVRVALDTNRLTDLFQGDAELADRLGECDEVWIPLMVLAEMKAGFLGGSQQHRRQHGGRGQQSLVALVDELPN